MGNIESGDAKIKPVIKYREYELIKLNIPYGQLEMIKVLQSNFNYEVKGTIYFNRDHEFSSFAVRTDSSEIYSYGETSWRIFFHTHPDNTAKKYGVRYFSPPSVDDILEIYEHSINFVPTSLSGSLGEISIIFTNEGVYVLQVNRDNFAKFNETNMPIELLKVCLDETFTKFAVGFVRERMQKIVESKTPGEKLDTDNPQISLVEYQDILKSLAQTTSDDYGFNMTYHTWDSLSKNGLDIQVYDYYVNK